MLKLLVLTWYYLKNCYKGFGMKLVTLLLLAASFLFANIDINYATVKELSTLKGIGSKKAEAIIAYRKVHCFKNIDEITNVKGIGPKFLEKNRKNLKTGSCKR